MGRRVLPAVLSLTLLASACGGEEAPRTSPAAGGVRAEQAGEAVAALCDMVGRHAGDLQAAGTAFHDRAHAFLHELAAAAEARDRTVAAELLEAKAVVESDLAGAQAPDLTAHVERLLAATRAALAAIGFEAPPCDT